MLEATHEFPCHYPFTVIVLNQVGIAAAVVAAVERDMAPSAKAGYETAASSGGKYVSMRFTIFCENLATDERYVVKHKYFFEPEQYFCWIDYDVDALTAWVKALCKRHLDP